MAVFDLGGETILAFGGRPAPSYAEKCTVPIEAADVSIEEYAEQWRAAVDTVHTAKLVGPLATEQGLVADSDN